MDSIGIPQKWCGSSGQRRDCERDGDESAGSTPEPWLRGTLTDVPAVIRAVLHALELAREDAERWCGDLTGVEVNARPAGLPSVAFQLRHISGSADRLLTYAEGRELSQEQMAELAREAEGAMPHVLFASLGSPWSGRASGSANLLEQISRRSASLGAGAAHHTWRITGARCRTHAAARRTDGDDREGRQSFTRAGLLRLSLSEQVSHPCLLGLEIALRKWRCRRNFGGDALDDANTLLFQRGNLLGIVRHQAHCVNA